MHGLGEVAGFIMIYLDLIVIPLECKNVHPLICGLVAAYFDHVIRLCWRSKMHLEAMGVTWGWFSGGMLAYLRGEKKPPIERLGMTRFHCTEMH